MYICIVFSEIILEVRHLGVLLTFMFLNQFLMEELFWATLCKILLNTLYKSCNSFFY